MTIRHTKKWLLVALLAAACNGNSRNDDNQSATTPTNDPPPSTATDVQPPPPGPGLANLRIRGVVNPGYTLFFLAVADLKVWVDGAPVVVNLDVAQTPMNLANTDHAWLMGQIPLPAPGKEVKVRLVLDELGAFEGIGAGDIDARGLPIEFTVPSDWFQPRRHAVIHLDLTRSLVGDGETRVLLPQLGLYF